MNPAHSASVMILYMRLPSLPHRLLDADEAC